MRILRDVFQQPNRTSVLSLPLRERFHRTGQRFHRLHFLSAGRANLRRQTPGVLQFQMQ